MIVSIHAYLEVNMNSRWTVGNSRWTVENSWTVGNRRWTVGWLCGCLLSVRVFWTEVYQSLECCTLHWIQLGLSVVYCVGYNSD